MTHTQREIESVVAALVAAIPQGDTSVSPRDLFDVVHDAAIRGEFLGDRAALLERARKRTAAGATPDESDASMPRLKARRPREAVFGRRLTEEIVEASRPNVIEMRRLCFAQSEPPFGTLEEAATWIEEHSVARWAPEITQDVDERYAALTRVCDELNQADRWFSYSSTYQPLNVEYWRGDGTLGVRVISKDTQPLAAIRRWANFVAEITLLPPAGLLAFLLVGLTPGQRVELPDGRTSVLPGLSILSRRQLFTGSEQIVLALDARELTDRNLRLLRQEAVRVAKPKRTTPKQQRVVGIVRQLGGPPSVRFDRDFWGRVAKRLKVGDPIAAARRFYRATEGS